VNPPRLAIEVTPEFVEQVATRVLKLLEERPAPEPEPWIGVEEAARHLACEKDRIYALTSKRAIPFEKDGSRVLFRRSDLDRFVRDGGATR
jgi:excisionase family DNA binding protein